MLPAKVDKGVAVTRVVDADEQIVFDAVADFVASQDLEVDHSDTGPGILFRPRPDPQTSGPWFFGHQDSLRVVVTPVGDHLSLEFLADMRGMHERGDAWRRRRYQRGGLLSLFLLGVGAQGLAAHGVNLGDFFPIAGGLLLGARSIQRAQREGDSREEIERNLANALELVCDEVDDA